MFHEDIVVAIVVYNFLNYVANNRYAADDNVVCDKGQKA